MPVEVAFQAASRVAAPPAEAAACAARLRFSAPRPAAAGTSGDLLARGSLQPGRTALRVRITGARLLRAPCDPAQRPTQTLVLDVGRDARRWLMRLDECAVRETRENIGAWFASRLTPDLVDDYYRSSAQPGHATAARVMVDPPGEGAWWATVCGASAALDVTLQLAGIYFRRQHLALLWRVVELRPAPAAAPARAPRDDGEDGGDEDGRGCGDDDEDDDDEDDDEDEGLAAPSLEERGELLAGLTARLARVRELAGAALREADDIGARLPPLGAAVAARELGLLADAEERLDALGLA